jgi:hypothetical protein
MGIEDEVNEILRVSEIRDAFAQIGAHEPTFEELLQSVPAHINSYSKKNLERKKIVLELTGDLLSFKQRLNSKPEWFRGVYIQFVKSQFAIMHHKRISDYLEAESGGVLEMYKIYKEDVSLSRNDIKRMSESKDVSGKVLINLQQSLKTLFNIKVSILSSLEKQMGALICYWRIIYPNEALLPQKTYGFAGQNPYKI